MVETAFCFVFFDFAMFRGSRDMIDRRGVLQLCVRGMLAGAGWFGAKLPASPLVGAGAGAAGLDAAAGDFDQELQAEMKRLQARVYSEQGIPMMLACENLAGHMAKAVATESLDVALATAFHREVLSWERLYPAAPGADVANLVELLAYRDFAGRVR